MDIYVQHLASLCQICGDEIEEHKRKVDSNRFGSEIRQNLERFNVVGFCKRNERCEQSEGQMQMSRFHFFFPCPTPPGSVLEFRDIPD